jgi:hypothetical protein
MHDWSMWRLILDLVQFVLVGAVSVYVYFTSANAVKAREFAGWKSALETQVRSTDTRLTMLEERSRHAPTHADLQRLHERLDDVSKAMHELAGEFKAARLMLDTVSRHLMRDDA